MEEATMMLTDDPTLSKQWHKLVKGLIGTVSLTAVNVFSLMLDKADENMYARISQEYIAEKLHITRKTAAKALKELETKLQIVKSKPEKPKDRSEYHLTEYIPSNAKINAGKAYKSKINLQSHMFYKLPVCLYGRVSLTAADVYAVMLTYAGADMNLQISQSFIAKELNINRKTVSKALKKLEAGNWVQSHRKNKRGDMLYYHLFEIIPSNAKQKAENEEKKAKKRKKENEDEEEYSFDISDFANFANKFDDLELESKKGVENDTSENKSK